MASINIAAAAIPEEGEIIKTAGGNFRITGRKVSDVPADRSAFLDGMEARFQQQLEARGDVKQRYRCAAATYLARPRLYGSGQKSYLFECYDLDGGEEPVAAYVYSTKDVYFESEKLNEAFGYLARVAPSHQAKGLGTLMWNRCTQAALAEGCAIGGGCIARDNYPQMKVMVRNADKTGIFPLAEQAIYLTSSQTLREAPGTPTIAGLGAHVERVDSAAAFSDICQQVFGQEGLRLVDPAELLSLPLHRGHYVARGGEGVAAGVSVWQPDYAVVVDPESRQGEYWLFYNTWSQGGVEGQKLLTALIGHLLCDPACPAYTLVSIARTDIKSAAADEVPEYAPNPLEDFVAPHAIGVEFEVITIGFIDYFTSKRKPKSPVPYLFIDPRDFSSLLTFHPVAEHNSVPTSSL